MGMPIIFFRPLNVLVYVEITPFVKKFKKIFSVAFFVRTILLGVGKAVYKVSF